jgi:Holliday junction DNA helicase RuvA
MTMIVHLHGVVVAKTVERVVVDVQGVGYQVVVPLSTYYALPDLQERATLLTTMYVREDTMRLYGFATQDEQDVFERLISVSSVGPRLALNMLSSLSAADLCQAIAQADTRRLQAIPGVGRKTAERVVLELQDKMGALDLTRAGPSQPVVTEDEQVMRDVVSALLNLGYRHNEAEQAVRAARANQEGSLTLEALLKEALQALVR